MSKLVKLNIIGLKYDDEDISSPAYGLILGEENSLRRMTIVIGAVEAQSIGMVLQEVTPPRPLTHDVFTQLVNAYEINLEKVVIYHVDKGRFFAEMFFVDKRAMPLKMDVRPSDAIAIAIRTGSPIYATEEVMSSTAVSFNSYFSEYGSEMSDDTNNGDHRMISTKKQSMADLQAALKQAVSEENYEQAKVISDEIKKRSS